MLDLFAQSPTEFIFCPGQKAGREYKEKEQEGGGEQLTLRQICRGETKQGWEYRREMDLQREVRRGRRGSFNHLVCNITKELLSTMIRGCSHNTLPSQSIPFWIVLLSPATRPNTSNSDRVAPFSYHPLLRHLPPWSVRLPSKLICLSCLFSGEQGPRYEACEQETDN